MKNLINVFILMAVLLSFSANPAQLPPNLKRIFGAPIAISCDTWTKERSMGSSKATQIEYWVLGYVSGMNVSGQFKNELLANYDDSGILDWMDNYCKDNPQEYVSKSISTMIKMLKNQ